MRRWPTYTLAGSFLAFFLLWLPGLKYPVVSDSILYGLLGRSLWQNGTYVLFGMPYDKHLPFHAFLSFPFTSLFGLHAGMKVSTFTAGCAVLWLTYLLVREVFSRNAALIAVAGVLFHPAFILMAQNGSADLLFTSLFLGSALLFVSASDRPNLTLWAWVLAGVACLTRYNGLPLLPFFFLWTICFRRSHLRSKHWWIGVALAGVIAGSWFVRNALVFGSPFHTEYSIELGNEAPNHLLQLWENLLYYGNPIHNLFPFFLPFVLYGIALALYDRDMRAVREKIFLIGSMLSVWVLTAIWWVQAMRFAFPAYPILLGFAGTGILHLLRCAGRWKPVLGVLLLAVAIPVHASALCLYTYGECNAWFDRTFGLLPPNMGITSEGFYAWHQAREYLNAHAEQGAYVFIGDDPLNAVGWREGPLFRADLVREPVRSCGSYAISQEVKVGEEVVFTSEAAPATSVIRRLCSGNS